jgi:hypothetical protein
MALLVAMSRHIKERMGEEIPSIGHDIDNDILELLGFDLKALIRKKKSKENIKNGIYENLIRGFYGTDDQGKRIELKAGDRIPKDVSLKGLTFDSNNLLLLRGKITQAFEKILTHIEYYIPQFLKGVPKLTKKTPLIVEPKIQSIDELIDEMNNIDQRTDLYLDQIEVVKRKAKWELKYGNEETKTQIRKYNPAEIKIIIFNQVRATAEISGVKVQAFTEKEIGPKPWIRLLELARHGKLDAPGEERKQSFRNQIKDKKKKMADFGSDEDQDEAFQNYKNLLEEFNKIKVEIRKEKDRWRKTNERLSDKLSDLLLLTRPPLVNLSGPLIHIFKSIEFQETKRLGKHS